MSTPEEHFNAARKFQEFYDSTLRKVECERLSPRSGKL